MKLNFFYSAFLILVFSVTALASDKEEVMRTLGIEGPNRESKITAVDLNSRDGEELYQKFAIYFEAKDEPIEFHDSEEINPSTIAYQINFLRKFYQSLIEEENQKDAFLLDLQKWKTQTLIDLVLKVGFVKEWNKSGKETIALSVLHDDLVHAVEGEKQMFLSVPEYMSKEGDHPLLKLLGEMKLDPVLYDELLIHLRANDYKSARLLNEESNKKIEKMDLLNQKIYGIFWPDWDRIVDIIEGDNQSGDDNSE